MKKIVELIVNLNDIEMGTLGGDALSLVANPAIELDFLAFKNEKFKAIDIFGFKPDHFDMCPKATALFAHLINDMQITDEDTQGMIRSAALQLDKIFEIESRVVAADVTNGDDLQLALILAKDFADLMSEIDEIIGMEHDLEFLMQHIDNIMQKAQQDLNFLENACWPGWEAVGLKTKDGRQVPNCVPVNAEKFSYSDYPDSAVNAAKRALAWREANPDTTCGTRVGWARANQLAKRENITESTIARMASFARHLQYKDVPYSEGCGGLMVDAWGGPAGIAWAQRKLEEIRNDMSATQKFAVDTSQLPQYVDELTDEQKELLSQLEAMGEEIDYQNTITIDASRATFSTLKDFLDGITALDILGRRGVTADDEEGVEVFRYAGPSAERGFCRAMLRLNKVYREDELRSLNTANPGFGENGSNNYDVFNFKGGPNCRHYFERLNMFKNGRETIFVSLGPAAGDAGQTNNSNAPSSAGAVDNNARLNFSMDEDQRIVVGPAMVPNKLIRRRDKEGNYYHVYFSKETVKSIAENFIAENKQNRTNVEHASEDTNTVNTLLESWIVEDSKVDKSAFYGFDVPVGSWMVSYKINDDETWQKIKSGELRGFSIEGYFLDKSDVVDEADSVFAQITDIIAQVDLAQLCPEATQDLEMNTNNRNHAIKAEHIKYGPLNVNEPGDYWQLIADHWDTSVEAAKQSNCSNCAAFDISPRMLECMPGELSDEDGQLGHCWMHDFKCHSARSCYTWAAGGPIVTDEVSYSWQSNAE